VLQGLARAAAEGLGDDAAATRRPAAERPAFATAEVPNGVLDGVPIGVLNGVPNGVPITIRRISVLSC
jgi:hypothetical protein